MRRNKGNVLGRSERRGMWAIGFTVFSIWAVRWLPQPETVFIQKKDPNSEYKRSFYGEEKDPWDKNQPQKKRFSSFSLRPFPFNPNTLPADSLLKLGLPNPIVQKWLKARERGFVFRKEEDILNFSILPQAVRSQLLAYVVLPKPPERVRPNWQAPPRPKILVELNRADTLELQGLPGIGPTLAQRVVKYRDRLGGFFQCEQLLEIYGIDSSLFNKILPQIQVNKKLLQTRSWNTISLEELKLFPYLTNKEAQIIVQYRKVHGPFATLEAVKKIRGIRSDIPEKLTPYLQFDM